MRASTFAVILAAASVASPAVASSGHQYSRRNAAELLLARQTPGQPTVADGQSGALSLGPIFEIGGDILNAIFGGGSSNSNSNSRRELLELLARADAATASAGSDPESDALSLSPFIDIGKAIFSLFGGGNNNNNRRELMELLARADGVAASADPESAALSLGPLLRIGGDIFGALFGGGSNNNNDNSSSSSKRELVELLARANAAAASSDPESAALSLSPFLSIGEGIFNAIFGGGNNSNNRKRELMALLARSPDFEEVVARSLISNLQAVNAKRALTHEARSMNDLD